MAGRQSDVTLIGETNMDRKLRLLNAFSLNMGIGDYDIAVRQVTMNSFRNILLSRDFESCLGHESTARALTNLFGVDVMPKNGRPTVRLAPGEHALVAQYFGERLPEYTKKLPDVSFMKWHLVEMRRCDPVDYILDPLLVYKNRPSRNSSLVLFEE